MCLILLKEAFLRGASGRMEWKKRCSRQMMRRLMIWIRQMQIVLVGLLQITRIQSRQIRSSQSSHRGSCHRFRMILQVLFLSEIPGQWDCLNMESLEMQMYLQTQG